MTAEPHLNDHRYRVGQTVDFTRNIIAGRRRYQVCQHLPAEGNVPQYRIRSLDDGHERVVREHQIQA